MESPEPRRSERAESGTAPAPVESEATEELPTMSPSRAADFTTCPLLYRFRVIDRLPEAPSPAAVRGTLVHRVLEQLFELPAADRTSVRALELVRPAWAWLCEQEPEASLLLAGDLAAPANLDSWLAEAERAVIAYFALEDPRRVEPAGREVYVEAPVEGRVLLRGVIDRVDESPDGLIRITDYKTGRAPGVGFEALAMFQLRFYALIHWRLTGVVPTLLRLLYLGSGETISYRPDEEALRATERKAMAVREAITVAEETDDFQPQVGRQCGWCPHRQICPAWADPPSPLPPRAPTARA